MPSQHSHALARTNIPQPACLINRRRATNIPTKLKLRTGYFRRMPLQQVNRLTRPRIPNLNIYNTSKIQ